MDVDQVGDEALVAVFTTDDYLKANGKSSARSNPSSLSTEPPVALGQIPAQPTSSSGSGNDLSNRRSPPPASQQGTQVGERRGGRPLVQMRDMTYRPRQRHTHQILDDDAFLEALAEKVAPMISLPICTRVPNSTPVLISTQLISGLMSSPVHVLSVFVQKNRVPQVSFDVSKTSRGFGCSMRFGHVIHTFGDTGVPHPTEKAAKDWAASVAIAWLIETGVASVQSLNRMVGQESKTRRRSDPHASGNSNLLPLKRRILADLTPTPPPAPAEPGLTMNRLLARMDLYQMHLQRVAEFCDYLGIEQPSYAVHETTSAGTRWCASFPSTEMFLARAGTIGLTAPMTNVRDGKEACARLLEQFLMDQVKNGNIECAGSALHGTCRQQSPAASTQADSLLDEINRELTDHARAVTMRSMAAFRKPPQPANDETLCVVDAQPSSMVVEALGCRTTPPPVPPMIWRPAASPSYVKTEMDSKEDGEW